MNKKIFRSSLIVSLLAVFACIVFVIGILFQYFENQLKKELKNEATYVAVAIKTQGIEYLNNFGEQNEKRITLIDPNGTVIADTIVDEENMELEQVSVTQKPLPRKTYIMLKNWKMVIF